MCNTYRTRPDRLFACMGRAVRRVGRFRSVPVRCSVKNALAIRHTLLYPVRTQTQSHVLDARSRQQPRTR